LSALYVGFFGLTPADLARQPEASLAFPGARLERETSSDATFDILFGGLSRARFGRDYRTPAPIADVVAFYREALESRGWSVLVGLHDFDACARGLQFSVRSRFTSATFAIEISQFDFGHPPECREGMAPAPEAVALVSVVAFTAYIARASLLQRRARGVRGGPLRAAGGVARWGPAFAFVPYLILDGRPGPTTAPSELIVDIGIALVVVGAAIAWWAASALGPNFDLEPEVHEGHGVVRGGPYRLVRHPVYVGIGVHLAGACFASGNLALIVGVLFAGFPLLYLRARTEEQLLRAELGSVYDAYRQDVGMFFPRWPRRRVEPHG
jgi:protein-S-isoprenylcysteine O-methyltransferase Ste14